MPTDPLILRSLSLAQQAAVLAGEAAAGANTAQRDSARASEEVSDLREQLGGFQARVQALEAGRRTGAVQEALGRALDRAPGWGLGGALLLLAAAFAWALAHAPLTSILPGGSP